MRLRLPRQAKGSCSPGKSFYRCNKGPYTGCCSTNPCDTGVCGDDTTSKTATAKPLPKSSKTSSASLSTRTASKSSPATGSTSALTSTTTSPSRSTEQTATSIPSSDPSASTLRPDQTAHPPAGKIAGGVLGGLAFLALLAALLWYCLRRKSKLRIQIGRGKKKVDEQRERELIEAKAAVLDRERFLDAARERSAPETRSQDPFAEFGGYYRDNNSNSAGSSGGRYYPQHNQRAPLHSTFSQAPKPSPTVTTQPAPAPASALGPSNSQQSSMPLSSISEKENVESIPILDGTELTPLDLSVVANATGLNQQAADHGDMAWPQPVIPVESLGVSKSQRVNGTARIPRPYSTDSSSVSSTRNSYANTISPLSPSPPQEVVIQDGVVMRSNLNGSWNRRARQGSRRKHVMSFMEYDTENESVCSSSRRSSLRIPGKAVLLGDEGWGLDHQDSSLRR